MPSNTKENGFETLIVDSLVNNNGYEQGDTSEYHKEYAMLLSVLGGGLILFMIFQNFTPALSSITDMLSASGVSGEYTIILIKTLGTCFLAQFAADACRDAGESSLASKVELAGKVAVILMALPLFEAIANTAITLIGG